MARRTVIRVPVSLTMLRLGQATLDRDDFKRRVMEATDIVRLIGEHVSLRPRGREFIGVCPFHDDKNPSLNVSPTKQIYKCFSCGAGGDVLSFVTDYHKMTFPEAIRFLADRAGIPIPTYNRPGGSHGEEGPSPRQRILDANKLALAFYRQQFRDAAGAVAREYAEKRGINAAMLDAFQVGYAPDKWDALAAAVTHNRWDREAFIQAGLLAKRTSGDGCYDRLRHRLIFPILDAIGRPIAFGGRTLPNPTVENNADAKYLNSPETPLFNKSATLFGLHAAHKPMIDTRTAVIVEGYTDVIACHQAGVRNVVATLGTALTVDHAGILRRYCDRVLLVFDGDEAGQKAADRALQVFFGQSLDIGIVVIPGGLDPADLFEREDGVALWRQAIADAADALSFQFARLRQSFDAQITLTGRQRIAEDYLRNLVQLGLHRMDRTRYGMVFARLGEVLGMSPAAVADIARKIPVPRSGVQNSGAGDATSAGRAAYTSLTDPGPTSEAPDAATRLAERQMVGCLLNRPSLFDATAPDGRPLSESIVPADFADPETSAVYLSLCEYLLEAGASGVMPERWSPGELRQALGDEASVRLATAMQIEVDRLTESDPDRTALLLEECARFLIGRRAQQEYRQMARPTDDQDKSRWAQQALERLRNQPPSAQRFPRMIG